MSPQSDTPSTSAMRPPLAYHHHPGRSPTIVFLPGYGSDMSGTKALALEAWARREERAFLRFDYGGCGQSEGAFEEQTIAGWHDDVLAMIDTVAQGPVLLVGSSLGGWLMLLATRDRPDRVVGLVGVAAAPDFTDWGFTVEEKLALLTEGRLERPSRYGTAPLLYTRALWSSGEALRVLHGTLPIDCPVRLLHGLRDADVPHAIAVRVAEAVRSADVQLLLIKGGDHRLSRPEDIVRLQQAIEDIAP